MSEVGPEMNRWAEAWKAALQERAPEFDVGHSRERFMATFHERAERTRRKVWPWALAAAAAVALGVAALTGLSDRAPHAVATVEPGAWIETKRSETFPLEFSEGSKILLESSSRAQVASVDPRGARVVLLRGAVKAKIVHRPDTAWAFAAGPFTVDVTGTELRVSWDPAGQRFEVNVDQGSVLVTGPLIESGRSVRAGQRCAVSMGESKLEVTPSVPSALGSAVPTASAAPELPPLAEPKSLGAPKRSVLPSVPATGSRAQRADSGLEPPGPSWKELERRGRYREAVEGAEQQGLEKIYSGGSAEDLMTLARAARLAGRGSVGKAALLKVRQRFAGQPQAAVAAFLLGRNAAAAEAAQWFIAYLNEQPSGPFAREAAGRLVEAHHRAGNQVAAKDAARNYLASYPGGPHAAFARQVLGE